MPVLAHKFLLIPDLRSVNTFPPAWRAAAQRSGLLQSIYNASEWMLIGKENFDFSGRHCNRIGVSYTAFRNQQDPCSNRLGRLVATVYSTRCICNNMLSNY